MYQLNFTMIKCDASHRKITITTLHLYLTLHFRKHKTFVYPGLFCILTIYFRLGLAIPSGYGNTWIKVGDEVKRNLHLGINMSDFFVGENFKVHPQWVYCKYHYLEGKFSTKQMEYLIVLV